jgi:aryl-alcohol dehydrogenase-like predicted oxidoreductase
MYRRTLGRSGIEISALGWLWAKSEKTIPIPGFKTISQVEENAGAAQYGPLSNEQMERIAALLA